MSTRTSTPERHCGRVMMNAARGPLAWCAGVLALIVLAVVSPLACGPTPPPAQGPQSSPATQADGGAIELGRFSDFDGDPMLLTRTQDRVFGVDADAQDHLTAVTGRGMIRVVPHDQHDSDVRWVRFDRSARGAVVSRVGHRAVVVFDDVVELWSTEPPIKLATLQRSGSVKVDPVVDDAGRVFAVPSCDAAPPGAALPCRIRMFAGQDGKVISEAPAAPDDLQPLRFDAAGRYLLQETSGLRRVLRVGDGREVLRRFGTHDRYSSVQLASYATQGARDDVVDVAIGGALNAWRTDVFSVEGDLAVVSLDDAVEVIDLKDGAPRRLDFSDERVVAKKRQLHHLLLGGGLMLSVDSDQRVTRLIDLRAVRIVRSGTLPSNTFWEHMLLRNRRDGSVLLCDYAAHLLDIASMRVRPLSRDVAKRECRQLEQDTPARFYLTEQSTCRYQPAGARDSWEVPFASCLHRQPWRDGWVSYDNEGFEVYDARARRVTFSFGVRLRSWDMRSPSPATLGIVDEDLMGFAQADDRVYLTQRTMPKFPAAEGNCVRSARFQFCGSHSHHARHLTVHTLEGRTLELALPATGHVVPVHARGDALVAHLDERALFCQVEKGCVVHPYADMWPSQLTPTHAFLRGDRQAGWRDRDGSMTLLPQGCFAALEGSHAQFVCLDSTRRASFFGRDLEGTAPGIQVLSLRDEHGPRAEFHFTFSSLEGEPLQATGAGAKVMLQEHHRALVAARTVLSAKGVLARVLADGRGAWAVYADGKYERFGSPAEVAPALWCRQGDRLVVPERCPERQVQGRMDDL